VKNFKLKYLLSAIVLVVLSTTIVIHNVPQKITEEDKVYIQKLLPEISVADASSLSFEEQIQLIIAVQNNVHEIISLGNAIEYSQPREPRNLYENQSGICYDFSRTKEKMFMYLGFKTRHVAIYRKKDLNFFEALFTSKSLSHSTSEVLTQKGWMIVDSNYPWIALDTEDNPQNMKTMRRAEKRGELYDWQIPLPNQYNLFYEKPVYVVYGLYSRHGKFFPPYNSIPDYNLRQLFYNFF
jgi:hypothetical protein